MKKFLSIVVAAACLASMTTACHDDDENEGQHVADYSDNLTVKTVPSMLSNVLNYAGTALYMLSDGTSDVFHYTILNEGGGDKVINAISGAETNVAEDGEGESYDQTSGSLSKNSYKAVGESFYGGFTPTWLEASTTCNYDNVDDGAYSYVPISGSYKSSTALICNPGDYCRALFCKNLTGLSLLTVKKIKGLYVQAPKVYSILKEITDNGKQAYAAKSDSAAAILDFLKIDSLPANTRIEFLVYGYSDGFSFSSFKQALEQVKNVAKDAAQGGVEGNPITLIETDDKGKVTNLLDDWAYLDLTIANEEGKKVSNCYLYEASIRVVDAKTGKKITTYEVTDNFMMSETPNSALNYVLVDNIAYETRW